MTALRQQRGQQGEDVAARHLESLGYKIVTRNWRPNKKEGPGGMRGEIDIIAWIGPILCIIEVKSRSNEGHGAPQEAVNLAKQRQLSRLANAYVSLHRLHDTPCRFDVVEVLLAPSAPPRVRLCQNAFDYCG
jgi:putative endonuclease